MPTLAQAPKLLVPATTGQVKEKPEEEQAYQTATDDSGQDAERKREIELVGMRVTMAFERQNNRQPEDVSGENHGFDVRSVEFDADGAFAGIRYIEVKARAQSGAIRLSANEWKKARRYGDDFWLYIITQAGSNEPELQRIQNPAGHFLMDEDIYATGFIIPEDKWQQKLLDQSG